MYTSVWDSRILMANVDVFVHIRGRRLLMLFKVLVTIIHTC